MFSLACNDHTKWPIQLKKNTSQKTYTPKTLTFDTDPPLKTMDKEQYILIKF
jgi:hypothetical protein